MAVPTGIAIGNAMAGVIATGPATVAGTVTGAVASGVLNGPMLYLAQASLANSPHLLPSLEVMVDLYHKGRLSYDGMRRRLLAHGVPTNSFDASWDSRKGIWEATIREMLPVPNMEIIRRAKLAGEITLYEFQEYRKRFGLWRNADFNLFTSHFNSITPDQTLVALNRGVITEQEARVIFARNGVDRTADQDQFLQLRYWYPGPADVISWAVKDVWQPEIVNRFQYDAEFPAIFQQFMDRQGAGWKPSERGIPVAAQFDITLPQAYWRAHWNVISPTQAMDAVHRLRPIAPGNPGSRTIGVPAFTRDDFNLILRTADYPPIMREWLFGLSFTPLSRIDIRRFSRLLPWTRQDILERYRDLGYSEADAGVQADFTLVERHAMETGRDRARIETVVRQLYEECIYSSGEAAAALKAARLKTPAQQAEFGALSTAEQQAQGLADPAISYLIGSLDAKKKLNLAKKTKSAVRAAVLRREVDLNTAQLLLAQAGITGNCATELLQLWQLEMQIKGKPATAAAILKWFIRGAITGQEVALRLSLMGYSNRDITAMLAVAGQDISLAVARQRKQLATDERGRIQALRTELRLLRQQRKEAIADLNLSSTKAQVLKFYSSGLVSREEALAALIQRGVFPKDADLFLDDIDNAKSKTGNKVSQEQTANGQASQPTVNGNEGSNTEL